MSRNAIIGIIVVIIIILLAIFLWPRSTNVPTGTGTAPTTPAPTTPAPTTPAPSN